MSSGFSLDGKMIPRRVKRLFDQRDEAREDAHATPARMSWRDRTIIVRLLNLSSSGAMIAFDEVPHIGEKVMLAIAIDRHVEGQVCWVRDGHVGLYFAQPLA